MDLLFFHRTLRRLVLIELKLGEFEPQDKGQVELYLRWLEKYERAEGEEKPIALIIACNNFFSNTSLGGILVKYCATCMLPLSSSRSSIVSCDFSAHNIKAIGFSSPSALFGKRHSCSTGKIYIRNGFRFCIFSTSKAFCP